MSGSLPMNPKSEPAEIGEDEVPEEILALCAKEQLQFQRPIVMMTWARTRIPHDDDADYVWFLCYRTSSPVEDHKWLTVVRFAVCSNSNGHSPVGGIAHTYWNDRDPDGA